MKTTSIDSFFATVCFALVNLLILALNFSVWGCIAVAATLLYFLLRVHVWGEPDKQTCCIQKYLADYLGATVLDTVAILACADNIFKSGLVSGFKSNMIWSLIVLAAGFCVSRFIFNSYANLYTYRYILRYVVMGAAAVGSSYLCIKWNLTAVVTVAVMLTAAALLIDLLGPARSELGYNWLCVLCIVFTLLAMAYPQFLCDVVNMIYNYRAHNAAPIPAYIGIAALFVACAVQVSMMSKTKSETGNAARLYLFFASFALLSMLTECISTAYDMVFILLSLAVQLVFLLGQRTDRSAMIAGIRFPVVTMHYVAAVLMTVLLPVMFYVGLLWEYVCVMAAIVGVYLFFTVDAVKGKEDAAPVYKTWMFWQMLLTAAFVYGLVVTYTQCHFTGGYVFLTIIYIAATLALLILNIENKRLKKNHSVMRITVAVAMALLMIFVADQVHFAVDYAVDNHLSSKAELDPAAVGETDTITVTVTEKDDAIKKCYAYWVDDKDTVIPIVTDKDAENTLAFRDGGLCVVCEYESGVVATDTQWFYDQDHMEKTVHVGTPRYRVGIRDKKPSAEKDAAETVTTTTTTTAKP